MTVYLLDTNVVSELGKPKPDGSVLKWLAAVPTPYLSAITVGELTVGVQLLPPGRRRTELEVQTALFLGQPTIRVLPVTEQVAVRWGELVALRQRAGQPLPLADGLIAATAVQHDLTLATRNTRDFVGLGLRLINPWLEAESDRKQQ